MVGSKDYFSAPEPENCTAGLDCRFEGNFNVATQGLRQPGSAMKPFAYVTAFQKGYSPETVVFDTPTEFAANNPKCPTIIDFSNNEEEKEDKKECFHPQNFDDKFRGPVKLRTALAQSINVPSVKVLYLAGINDTLETAHNFGITTLTERSRYGLSLVLGGGEVILKELVGAYSVFAQEGKKHDQIMILKIIDYKGNTIEEYKDRESQVIDSQFAGLINDILADVDERAGLFSSSLYLTVFPGHEVALKTGTTNDYRDAWAIGYTPDLVVGVWAGNNNNESMKQRGSSILAAVPIWNSFMKEALKNKPLASFNKPAPILVYKPMLNGEYVANYKLGDRVYPHIHNILYYIDKREPQSAQPDKPENDSQFKNWEDSVLKWAEQTIPNFSKNYNQPLPYGARTEVEITGGKSSILFISPKNGEFIRNQIIPIQAQITGEVDIIKIQLFFNNELKDEQTPKVKEFNYQFNLSPKIIELQNSLKIKTIDSSNNETVKEIILFK
jgi:membrane carboxypeptidase/penicillin-binding protein